MARQTRGFSQQQLAGMAGVSRQAVSAVESGHSDPSLRVALALAQALGLSVEELFGPGEPTAPVTAVSVAPLGGGGAGERPGAEPAGGVRVTLAPVGDRFVALPLRARSLRARFRRARFRRGAAAAQWGHAHRGHRGGRLPRPEQLLDRQAERLGEGKRHPQGRVGMTRFDGRDRLPADPGHARELLLREPAGLPGDSQSHASGTRSVHHAYGS
jgi:DNA-binding XRE family transcriptional regulator